MYEQWGVISDVTPEFKGTELTVKTEYLLMPVMARFYVAKGLSIGVGLQTGFMTKAKAKLGWNPNKTTFEQLVKIMVEHDMAKVAAEGAAAKVRTNLAEYLEKGVVK